MTSAGDSSNRRQRDRSGSTQIGRKPPTCKPIPSVSANQATLTPGELVLLAGFVDRVRAAIAPATLERITLFGSRARGQWHAGSDLDVAVFIIPTAASDPDQQHLPRRLSEIADQAQTGWEDLPLLRPILIATNQPINRTLLSAIDADGVQLLP